MFDLTTLTTELDAHWYTIQGIVKGRVDLLSRYTPTPIASDGVIALVDPTPMVIIQDAIFDTDSFSWHYLNADGIDVAIPAACSPLLAWRPVAVRHEAAKRALDIDHMVNFLRAIGKIDARGAHIAERFSRAFLQRTTQQPAIAPAHIRKLVINPVQPGVLVDTLEELIATLPQSTVSSTTLSVL